MAAVVIPFVTVISCKQNLDKVIFPDSLNNETREFLQKNNCNVLIYMDSVDCSPCLLNAWKPYKRILEKNAVGILLIMNYVDESHIIAVQKQTDVKFHYIKDKNGEFKTKNKIFQFAKDNIFVIDKNSNVIFIESPIKNELAW
ncbi:MAG: hypothetical protein LBG92_02400, partial [Prevotellaceae bacterium]|nr:hypothetical protein [Prevotellaceae bacterium]